MDAKPKKTAPPARFGNLSAAHFRQHATAPARGIALLLVLGFVVLLSFISFGILKNMQRELLYQAEGYAKPQLEIAARAGLESTLAVLANFKSIDGALYSPQQGWAEPLALAGFEYVPAEDAWKFDKKTLFTVAFRDESGRFPLATMDAGTLSAFFVALGIATSETEKLADCLLDWTDADDNKRLNGAEIDDYDAAGTRAIPPNCALRDLSELREILNFREIFFDDSGTPNELFTLFEEAVSLNASKGKPNINTATPAALLALTADTDADAGTILEYLNSKSSADGAPHIFRNANDLSRAGAETLANKISFNVRTLRIVVTARRGEASFVLDTLVEISTAQSQNNSSPFKIIRQTQNDLRE